MLLVVISEACLLIQRQGGDGCSLAQRTIIIIVEIYGGYVRLYYRIMRDIVVWER